MNAIRLRLARSLSTSASVAAAPMRLAVCGAGPAGLVVAGILSRAKNADASPLFTIDVFERDLLARGQGAGWDIDENAQKIFERAGLEFTDWRQGLLMDSSLRAAEMSAASLDGATASCSVPEQRRGSSIN